jgi:hypothetical protein
MVPVEVAEVVVSGLTFKTVGMKLELAEAG